MRTAGHEGRPDLAAQYSMICVPSSAACWGLMAAMVTVASHERGPEETTPS